MQNPTRHQSREPPASVSAAPPRDDRGRLTIERSTAFCGLCHSATLAWPSHRRAGHEFWDQFEAVCEGRTRELHHPFGAQQPLHYDCCGTLGTDRLSPLVVEISGLLRRAPQAATSEVISRARSLAFRGAGECRIPLFRACLAGRASCARRSAGTSAARGLPPQDQHGLLS